MAVTAIKRNSFLKTTIVNVCSRDFVSLKQRGALCALCGEAFENLWGCHTLLLDINWPRT
jgi:hypothetical protein